MLVLHDLASSKLDGYQALFDEQIEGLLKQFGLIGAAVTLLALGVLDQLERESLILPYEGSDLNQSGMIAGHQMAECAVVTRFFDFVLFVHNLLRQKGV